MSKKIKDEQKKFLGETLNQYDKALDEGIDKLDKKNREQNHKISALTNSFDNEYLEKDIEGNMTTLENSKDGMVIIDEIQGNTEVNYCKDGEKELILNGDIDTQGESFVTLTEGVDGGLVDVSLEGNTLVNVSKTKDDYITPSIEDKADQGSVISLPEVSEGYINIDGIEGNTLVNYCTDGAKEMTLNGDIDIEGTFVTTTEGVDNGLVDVMCEGNTLVNTIGKFKKNAGSPIINDEYIQLSKTTNDSIRSQGIVWKPSTVYTMFYTILETNLADGNGLTLSNASNIINTQYIHGTTVGKHKETFTTKDDGSITTTGLLILISNNQTDDKVIKLKDIFVLEGDWTNRETPPYFEGMKSVGQDDENGHKIEILSRKSRENLLIGGGFEVRATKDSYADTKNPIKIDPNLDLQSLINKTLLLSVYKHTEGEGQKNPTMNEIMGNRFGIHGVIRWGKSGDVNSETDTYPLVLVDNDWGYINTIQYKVEKITPPVGYDTIKSFNISLQPNSKPSENNNATWILKNAKLEIVESKTDTPSKWCPHLSEDTTYQYHNKKEILLNEPLRGLPNGTKDRIVKIGGKWYIERNCGEFVLDGSIKWNKVDYNFKVLTTVFYTRDIVSVNLGTSNTNLVTPVLSLQFPYANNDIGQAKADIEGIYTAFDGNLCISIAKAKLSSDDSSGLKSWLQSNPVKVVYQLATPTYEPLEVESVLNTYNEITHISNNSLIPCNMKIKNTGYNAIIKPSTLYTVALDTNKSGTIGMNLGGAKVTTTNDVATITTPATLTDDSLRLYGKGIKGSKVRILEGDKTNWIPSHFEGMKSSFEDKVQEDGTYKMEILSNNGNLINLEEQVRLNKQSGMNCSLKEYNGVMSWKINSQSYIEDYNYLRYQYKPNTQYTMYFDCNMTPYDDNNDKVNLSINVMYENGYTERFTMYKDTKNVQFTTLENRTVKKIYFSRWQYNGYVNIYNMKFCEGSSVLVEEKSNKIQFSSIEPLRGVGDVKDRFVFKDGKLMIERNCKKIILNDSDWRGIRFHGNTMFMQCHTYTSLAKKYPDANSRKDTILCDKYNSVTPNDNYNYQTSVCGIDINLGGALGLRVNNNDLSSLDEVGFKEYVRNNNMEVVFQLAEPTYEEIPYELQKIILESYENGTLFLDTNIPPTKVSFNCFEEELTYLYPSTSYTVQFISDKAITADITLGGTSLLAQNIVKGLNRISITTPSELVDNKLVINGVGAKISEVVVTDTDREFGYFEGMKSVGECEGLQVKSRNKNLFNIDEFEDGKYISQVSGIIINDSSRSYNNNYISINSNVLYFKQIQALEQMAIHCYDINKNWLGCRVTGKTLNAVNHLFNNTKYIRLAYAKLKSEYKDNNIYLSETDSNYIPHQSNTQQLTHEPLRAVGDVKDRYVLIDGKWYIERNWGIDNNLSLREWTAYPLNDECPNVIGFYCSNPNMRPYGSALICDKFKSLDRDAFPGRLTLNDEVISRASGDAPYFKMSINRDSGDYEYLDAMNRDFISFEYSSLRSHFISALEKIRKTKLADYYITCKIGYSEEKEVKWTKELTEEDLKYLYNEKDKLYKKYEVVSEFDLLYGNESLGIEKDLTAYRYFKKDVKKILSDKWGANFEYTAYKVILKNTSNRAMDLIDKKFFDGYSLLFLKDSIYAKRRKCAEDRQNKAIKKYKRIDREGKFFDIANKSFVDSLDLSEVELNKINGIYVELWEAIYSELMR